MTGGLVSIRFVLFALVGLSGVIVQLVVVRAMLWGVTDTFLAAQVTGVVAAMTTNFLFNNALTYRDRALRGVEMLRGLLSFYVVCSVGAVANVGVAEAVWQFVPVPELASLAGAVVGALWNFVASAAVTWRAR
jgi:dolichol-phosphate mannosyltransferase